MTTVHRTGTHLQAVQPKARAESKPKPAAKDNRRQDAFDPHAVYDKQHWDLSRNRPGRPETYPPEVRKKLYSRLDANGVVYPPIEDEAHVNKVRTTYASVDRKAGVLVVGLDNAAYHSKGYEGLSRGERRFARDMARYGKEHGLTTVFLCHVPPTVKPKCKLPDKQERAQQIRWMNELRKDYPDSLWVHGHVHHRKMIDLNGKKGGREVSNLILGGQADDVVTRITTYPHGRRIEQFEVLAGGRMKRLDSVVLSREGKRVDPAKHKLGKPMGVLYGFSDVHKEKTLEPYFEAIRRDATRMDRAGLAVSYLDAGDHTVKHKLPVTLPRQGRYFWAPGNHDYYNQSHVGNVVSWFETRKRKYRIEY